MAEAVLRSRKALRRSWLRFSFPIMIDAWHRELTHRMTRATEVYGEQPSTGQDGQAGLHLNVF
ncbi:MAG: hypothetical protein ACJ74Y_13455 [Bryobacteraceae bacterium]